MYQFHKCYPKYKSTFMCISAYVDTYFYIAHDKYVVFAEFRPTFLLEKLLLLGAFYSEYMCFMRSAYSRILHIIDHYYAHFSVFLAIS